jgi:recombination protein U
VDKEGKITRAVFGEKSTVDFDGIAFKRSIAFDAKETENKSFPLNNVEAHQREYLTDHQEQGGISFIIVRFSTIGETYILTIDQLNKWQHESLQGGRKSIPLDFFKTHCKQCKPGRNVPIDYLSCLEEEQTI